MAYPIIYYKIEGDVLHLSNTQHTGYEMAEQPTYFKDKSYKHFTTDGETLRISSMMTHLFEDSEFLEEADMSYFECTPYTATIPYYGFDALFKGCRSLKWAILPSCEFTMNFLSMFDGCTSLEWVDLSKMTYKEFDGLATDNAFNNCTSLKYIYVLPNTDWTSYMTERIGNIYTFRNCVSLPNYDGASFDGWTKAKVSNLGGYFTAKSTTGEWYIKRNNTWIKGIRYTKENGEWIANK